MVSNPMRLLTVLLCLFSAAAHAAPRHANLIAYAKRFIGDGNVTGFRGPWCGAFMGKVARHVGARVPRGFHKASEWVHAGPHVRAHVGAVAVMRHHVGIVTAVHGRTVTLLSGNHGHRVGLGEYSKRAIIAFVDIRER